MAKLNWFTQNFHHSPQELNRINSKTCQPVFPRTRPDWIRDRRTIYLYFPDRLVEAIGNCILHEMDNDDDFTFCQVSSPINLEGHETKKLVSDIGGIRMKDKFSNGSDSSQNSGLLWNEEVLNNTTFNKQGTVGSLSFNVIDMSSPKQSTELSRPVASGDVRDSVNKVQEQIVAKNPAPRAKVPFEKGYSQMDWLKLTRTHPDLAGLKGQSNKRLISMNEVKQHQKEGSMWTVLKGRVYNISPYMRFHPGGVDMLMKAVGKDCTSLFNKYHAWVNDEFLLEKCLVGTLDNSK